MIGLDAAAEYLGGPDDVFLPHQLGEGARSHAYRKGCFPVQMFAPLLVEESHVGNYTRGSSEVGQKGSVPLAC